VRRTLFGVGGAPILPRLSHIPHTHFHFAVSVSALPSMQYLKIYILKNFRKRCKINARLFENQIIFVSYITISDQVTE